MTFRKILVYGAGGFAREVKDVVDAMEEAGKTIRCVGFLDDAVKIALHGGRFAKAFHPTAVASRYVEYGEGSIVTAAVILTNRIRVGRHVILNLDATVGHDCVLEDFVTIAPGVHISGNVHIGEGTDVGTGTVVIPGVRIGRWSVVGAGAVVTKDLPDNCTAVGVPAKVVKTREEGWHLA